MSLISCLCVSKNSFDIVKPSIESFLNQTYRNKELIFIYETNNNHISKIKENYNDPSIKYIEIEHDSNQKLGYLRNKSVDEANGELVIQWDDDDIYHPRRLEIQEMFLRNNQCDAVMLDQRYISFEGKMYLSNVWPFEGSMMCKKNILSDIYINKSKGEDTVLLVKLLRSNVDNNSKTLLFLNCPELYIYNYHGENVYERDHFLSIVKCSKLKNPDTVFNYTKSKINNMEKRLLKVLNKY